jgi:hypothetical protein
MLDMSMLRKSKNILNKVLVKCNKVCYRLQQKSLVTMGKSQGAYGFLSGPSA